MNATAISKVRRQAGMIVLRADFKSGMCCTLLQNYRIGSQKDFLCSHKIFTNKNETEVRSVSKG